jgi:hypothetical protein
MGHLYQTRGSSAAFGLAGKAVLIAATTAMAKRVQRYATATKDNIADETTVNNREFARYSTIKGFLTTIATTTKSRT